MTEFVVLVDEENKEIGLADKDSVHSKTTPLHRGFSCFLFNSNKQLLLTQRALTKKTFPGVWTNTVCGHPSPGESAVRAAKRRLKDELGIIVKLTKEIAPYRYCFTDKNGVQENEICPIIVAYSDKTPQPSPSEIEDWKWIDWKKFLVEIEKRPQYYSPWSIEEVKILQNKLTVILKSPPKGG